MTIALRIVYADLYHISVGFCVARSYDDGQCEGLYKWERAKIQFLRFFIIT